MALPPSETSTSKGKSQTNEMKISSTEQEAGEARSPNNGRLSPTPAPSVNCNVLSYNGTGTVPATREASFKAKEAHNSVEFGRSKRLRIKLKKCSVLLNRIHVSENYKYACSEKNENNICSEEIAFPEPHPKRGSEDSERPKRRSEKVGKSGGPNSSEENKLNISKNTDSLRRTSLSRSKRLNASMKEDHRGFQLDHLFTSTNLIEKPYKCSDCSYAATSKSNLNSHIKSVHLKIKPYKCDLCAYAAVNKAHLFHHIAVVHQKLRRYKCHECAYAAAVKSNLTHHVKAVHLKLKPFKCDECDSYFSLKGNLKSHISRVHLKDKPHSCPHCCYSYESKAGLARHVASVHLKLKPHKCQTCKRGFYQKTKLEQHMKSVHMNLREHKCSQCDYAAGSRGDLRRHVDVVHLKINASAEYASTAPLRSLGL
ncbi:zinc finger protein 85-like isoform X2 [Hyalella azteca]|uniref:Zinc finger protein 85-like isoform X2 n=1 Tax=Hyalella azteca TaxID=294128 RepID=A0A979FWZ4_HYAAZ|nr:zinc finger protein 85-like isoform X2 [Hyalella azteca]